MADLGDRLRRAAPTAPAFDPDTLAHRLARRKQRRVAIATSVIVVVVAAAVTAGVAADRRKTSGGLLVSPTTTTPAPGTTIAPTTTTLPSRPTTAPVQTSDLPGEAFVAVGPSVIAIDPREPTRRKTLTTFPGDASITWITADVPHERVFVGVTSGCDPGVNGMYEVLLNGGARSKIAPTGNRVAVSPDGRTIAYSRQTDGCGSRDLVLQSLTGAPQKVFTANQSIDVGGWSADGRSLFLSTYDGNAGTTLRFRPFDNGARIDESDRWARGLARDSGGRRVAILDWCSGTDLGRCVVGVRTRDDGPGPDYDFGRDTGAASLSIDSTGQWPLTVRGNAGKETVSYFADGTWHVLAEGYAADW